MDHRQAAARLDQAGQLDGVVAVVERLTAAVPAEARDLLHGTSWLGHPLHPLLTDLPIGFFTNAMVLDVLGGRRMRPAAQRLVGLGLLSAVPTALAGLADWSGAGARAKRTGVVHAAANAAGVGLYAMSWRARRRGAWARGAALSLLGGALLTAGGYLGGHLSYSLGTGVEAPVS